jgi:putative hemolysin
MMINPSISLVDLKSLVQFAIPPGQYSTLSGYIYHELGRVPEIGDSVESPDCKVVVEAMDGHRITQVSIKMNQPPADPATTAPDS